MNLNLGWKSTNDQLWDDFEKQRNLSRAALADGSSYRKYREQDCNALMLKVLDVQMNEEEIRKYFESFGKLTFFSTTRGGSFVVQFEEISIAHQLHETIRKQKYKVVIKDNFHFSGVRGDTGVDIQHPVHCRLVKRPLMENKTSTVIQESV